MMQSKCFFTPLYQVVTAINSTLNPQEVLQKVTEQVAKTLNGKACTIRLLDRTGKLLLASASYGLSKNYMRKGHIELAKSLVDMEVLKQNTTAYVENAITDPRFQYPEAAKNEGLASILIAPLRVENKGIGVLRVYSHEKRTFTAEEQDFLLAVSHIAAIAIQNAKLHEALRSDYELLTEYNYQVFED